MKLADPATNFEGNLPAGTRLTFQLKSNPKMFGILSDGIYSDKIAAVIRELSCNAHDSNVMAKSPKRFKINVPSQLDSNFWVEDTGLGIDPEKIVDIFWTYGASTKTDSNDTIGALGLGSKSPFAYTKSSFLVINRYNGVEYKYFCFINEAGVPDGKLIHQQDTTEPNGVRVELAVRSNDIRTFREKIIKFFSFWDDASMPDFDGDGDDVKAVIEQIKARRIYKGKSWVIRSSNDAGTFGNRAYAVMGGVPYPINTHALNAGSQKLKLICESALNITFPMGSLDFQVSREELSYTDETIKTLEDVSAKVIDDIADYVRGLLVGHATPMSLAKAYGKITNELSVSFPYIKRILGNQRFSLSDGRTFTSEQLVATECCIKAQGHVKFNVQELERRIARYQKGMQLRALEPKLKVLLERPQALDPKTGAKRSAVSTNIFWFKPGTLAVAKNPLSNRKPTAANFLHDGYEPKETVLNQRVHNVAAIINDMGERGAEGIRFYKENFTGELENAFNSNTALFIDGSPNLNADETEAEFKAFIRSSLLEGMPIVRLSALPNFKLPEAPPKSVGPRNPSQKGTVELRLRTYTFSTKVPSYSSPYAVEWYEGFELKFYAPDKVKTDYLRHQLDKPLLYVVTSYGNPITSFHKTSVEPQIIGALRTLNLLDQFATQTPDGLEVRVGLLTEANLEELRRRKVQLVSMEELQAAVKELLKANVKLLSAFNQRYYTDGAASTAAQTLTSKLFLKHGMKHVAKTSKLAAMANSQERINGLLENKQNSALVYLTAWTNQHQLLNGKVELNKFVECYELLNGFAHGHKHNTDLYKHIALYINMVDAMHERQREEENLQHIEQVLAAELFE